MLRFSLYVFLLFLFQGCMPLEEESVTLSFWSDRFDEEGYTFLFVNEAYAGEFSQFSNDPECGQLGLIEYIMTSSEDLEISVRNSDGDSIEIGVLNLYSVSTGIKIKPNEDAHFFVDRSLDDTCTLVYVDWK